MFSRGCWCCQRFKEYKGNISKYGKVTLFFTDLLTVGLSHSFTKWIKDSIKFYPLVGILHIQKLASLVCPSPAEWPLSPDQLNFSFEKKSCYIISFYTTTPFQNSLCWLWTMRWGVVDQPAGGGVHQHERVPCRAAGWGRVWFRLRRQVNRVTQTPTCLITCYNCRINLGRYCKNPF